MDYEHATEHNGIACGTPLPIIRDGVAVGEFVYIRTELQLHDWMTVFAWEVSGDKGDRILSVDTETTGLNASTAQLLLLQLHAPGTPVLVIDCRAVPLAVIREAVRDMLEGEEWLKVGHNLGFDYAIIYKNLGLEMRRLYDSLLVERLLTAGLFADCGLENVTRNYIGWDLDKAIRKTFIDMPPDHEFSLRQLVYSAEDVLVLPPIVKHQQREIKKENILGICKYEFDVLPALAEAHVWGVRIDRERWKTFIEATRVEGEALAVELVEEMTPYLDIWRKKHEAELIPAYLAATAERANEKAAREAQAQQIKEALLAQGYTPKAAADAANAWKKENPLSKIPDKPEAGTESLNLNASAQIGYALIEMGVPLPRTESGAPTTKKEVMTALAETEEYPIVKKIQDWREMEKLVGTYGPIADMVDADDRLHAFFNQLVSTGRMSCREPNLQQVPKTVRGKLLRECFVARPGYKMGAIDFSAVEMRILAEVTGEPLLTWAILSDVDPHSLTALRMFEEVRKAFDLSAEDVEQMVTQAREGDTGQLTALHAILAKVKSEHKKFRDISKMINFGVAYGLSARGLSAKLNIPFPVAKKYIEDYFAANVYIDRWLKAQGARVLKELVSYTIDGRPRYFRMPVRKDFDIEWKFKAAINSVMRQGCNHVIQGTSAGITKLAVKLIRAWLKETGYDARMLLFIHDEVVLEIREDIVDVVIENIERLMEEAGRMVLTNIPATVEASVGDHWIH